VLGDDMVQVRERATLAASWLGTGQWTDAWSPHTGVTRPSGTPVG
jgi:5-(carboxyamino)imidazole ribonucleotide synthase